MQLRHLLCSALFLAIAGGGAGFAKAEPKPWYWSWLPSHWHQNMWQPYLEDAKNPQNYQWEGRDWEPADWAAQRAGGGAEVIKGFYAADILRGQYVKNRVPVLEVGPNFYHLSGYDKRRVVEMVDNYYGITSNHLNAMFTLSDWRTRQPIGVYTTHGLQLQ